MKTTPRLAYLSAGVAGLIAFLTILYLVSYILFFDKTGERDPLFGEYAGEAYVVFLLVYLLGLFEVTRLFHFCWKPEKGGVFSLKKLIPISGFVLFAIGLMIAMGSVL